MELLITIVIFCLFLSISYFRKKNTEYMWKKFAISSGLSITPAKYLFDFPKITGLYKNFNISLFTGTREIKYVRISGDTLRQLENIIHTDRLKSLTGEKWSEKKLVHRLKSLNYNQREIELILSHTTAEEEKNLKPRKHTVTYTFIMMYPLSSYNGFNIHIYSNGYFSKKIESACKAISDRFIETGDSEFDRAFVIKSDNHEKALKVITCETRKKLLKYKMPVDIFISGKSIAFETEGIIKSLSFLNNIVEIMADTGEMMFDESQKSCPFCGEILSSKDKFCISCGKILNTNDR